MTPLAHDVLHSPNAYQSAAIGSLRPISQSREQLDSGMLAEGEQLYSNILLQNFASFRAGSLPLRDPPCPRHAP
jgi:hypothetical protein